MAESDKGLIDRQWQRWKGDEKPPEWLDWTQKYVTDPSGMNKGAFSGSEHERLGGSSEALAEMRQRYQQGTAQGAQYTQDGIGTSQLGVDRMQEGAQILGGAAMQSTADRGMAQAMYDQGGSIGAQGIADQRKAIGQMRQIAAMDSASQASAQQRLGLDRLQGGMMAQAASARGGNQAAAMRAAQATGSQMGSDMLQRQAIMRAGEERARIDRMAAAETAGASMFGQQAGLGYQTQGQGMGYMQGATGQLADAGSRIGAIGAQIGQTGIGQAQVGVSQQSAYTTAELEANKAQLQADLKHEEQRQKEKGQWMAIGAKGISSMAGGGGGSMFG